MCTWIIAILLLSFTWLELVLLQIVGLQYESNQALIMFFIVYIFTDLPLSLIVDNIPKALKSLDLIQTSKGWIPFLFDAGKTYILIMTIDYFMESITISWQGVFLFAIIRGSIGLKIKKDDPEPPSYSEVTKSLKNSE
ncbi:YrvL family regulatory protein [Bacillus cytotoxicus]|uniref:YrvL family regulatory protein n=1 Tax=Bacillus cytotoxicus TaxID=580165 RepID=UPI0035CB45E0